MVNIVRFLVTVISIASLRQVRPDPVTHEYNKGDPITLYGNKVGPFHNPSETYTYYTLPYCSPDSLVEKKQSFGEMLNGDHLIITPYKINFLMQKDSQVLCRKNLTIEEVRHFQTAVARDYYTQLYFDDLPLWSFVGLLHLRENYYNHNEKKYFIYTHLQFDIFYNGNHVTEVILRTNNENATDITMDNVVEVEFLYTVTWKESNIAFKDRMQKYTFSAYLPHHMSVHKFSITSSLALILVLIGCLVGLYVFILQRDFDKSSDEEEELVGNRTEIGWKVLHGDVFRYPKYKSFFAAAIGCGLQLLIVIMFIILLGYMGVLGPYDRGNIHKALVFLYTVTCGVSGFTAVSFYHHQLEGTNWVRTSVLTGSISFGPLALIFCFLNTIAKTYGTAITLPFRAIMMILLIWVLLALPLLLLGGFLGKLFTFKFEPPCPTKDIPREIPTPPFYKGLLPQMLLGGFLSFGVLYIQLYYIFASVWGHRIYTMYGVLLIVFILFIITIALVSIGLTYFQLAAEDHLWWWRSFLCGGSTGLYMFAYCWYYYMERSNMDSFVQVSFFFGYMAWICYGFFLLSGSVAFGASFLFVRYIYSNIKCD